jgi:uncharacterized repeat protein (TIGR03803 family)
MTIAESLFSRSAGLNRLNSFFTSTALMLVTLVLVVAAAPVATAQTYTDLYNFGTKSGDPANPTYSGIIAQGRDGNLYSTAPYGGAHNDGAVFKITPTGTLTVVHSFDGTDGAHPWAGLTLGTDGNFYGVTFSGGKFGYGTIYRITPAGSLTTLHSFTNGTDAAAGGAQPIEGTDGNFYGTADGPGLFSNGVVYKITPSGVFTTLHTFDGPHGSHPDAPLVQGSNGDFYGTTYWGGTNGYGTIFRISPSGTFEMLFSFVQFDQNPEAAMIQGSDGDFYGTTTEYANGGIVFRIADPGGLTILHDFDLSAGTPYGGLVQATDGFFYGTTAAARYTGGPSIFRISSTGAFATLYNFESATGLNSVSTQVQHTSGLLFGETTDGGTFGLGVFYSFDVGLGPFVTFVRDSGIVGATAQILGQGFKDATAVSFNGTPASFTVESDTFLRAKVPAGATTGNMTVTESSGTLTSNKFFHVLPTTRDFVPNNGPAGTVVTISGMSLTQTTAVSFDGVQATSFSVISDTELQAIVPEGAKTGFIEITTAGGSFTTCDKFYVTP